jgi:hypothetical protein
LAAELTVVQVEVQVEVQAVEQVWGSAAEKLQVLEELEGLLPEVSHLDISSLNLPRQGKSQILMSLRTG